jgi:hypothetical protein
LKKAQKCAEDDDGCDAVKHPLIIEKNGVERIIKRKFAQWSPIGIEDPGNPRRLPCDKARRE